MKIEILGSGTSMGVPMAGCDCAVCQSTDPKDKRLRTSCLISLENYNLLIDTSADFRQQMLRSKVKKIDAVLYTHHHVDHILGMDDLRSYNLIHQMPIPLYGMPETLENIRITFRYAFNNQEAISSLPMLNLHPIDDQPFELGGVTITPIPLLHGKMPVYGYRIGYFAYCTDVSCIPETSFERLKNLEVLILGALRHRHHPTHFSIPEAITVAQKIGAKHTYFTHISHGVMHAETEASLPENIHLAFDGLTFEL
jgi:phosphoribosyl 1,2-cyclic phosphate phosphodiesterase